VKEGKWVPGRAVQYYDVAGYLVGRWAGAFTLLITIISLLSTSKDFRVLLRSAYIILMALSTLFSMLIVTDVSQCPSN